MIWLTYSLTDHGLRVLQLLSQLQNICLCVITPSINMMRDTVTITGNIWIHQPRLPNIIITPLPPLHPPKQIPTLFTRNTSDSPGVVLHKQGDIVQTLIDQYKFIITTFKCRFLYFLHNTTGFICLHYNAQCFRVSTL